MSESTPNHTPDQKSDSSASKHETAYLGSGCFWCTEAVFDDTPGVLSATSGYMGGHTSNPDYRQICTGDTGHAEVVKVDYDPQVIPYERILELFFATHDPTQLNRQGNDVGTQYRSAIFTTTPDQQQQAQAYIRDLKEAGYPVVTQVESAPTFYPAEEYHQKYYKKNPEQGYCQIMIPPKLKKKAGLLNKSGSSSHA